MPHVCVCMCLQLASSIASGLPAELSRERESVLRSPFAPLPSGHDNSLATVLAQARGKANGGPWALRQKSYRIGRSCNFFFDMLGCICVPVKTDGIRSALAIILYQENRKTCSIACSSRVLRLGRHG